MQVDISSSICNDPSFLSVSCIYDNLSNNALQKDHFWYSTTIYILVEFNENLLSNSAMNVKYHRRNI